MADLRSPTFLIDVVPSSLIDKGSKTNYPLNLKQKALLSFEILKNSNPVTQCLMQQDMDHPILKKFKRNRGKEMEQKTMVS